MNPNQKSGQETVTEFFNNLPTEDKSEKADIFAKPTEPVIAVEKTDDDEHIDDSIKNRRHRRLEAKLQAERETNIALNERIKVLSEIDKFAKETPDVDPDILRMFDPSDNGKQNALILSRKLSEIQEKAEERAVARIEKEKEKESAEFTEAGNFIDSQLETLEDTYKVSFYGSKKADDLRSQFLEFLEEISPKDKEGNLKDYADFESSFETFVELQSKSKPDNSRQREISSRSMQRSQSSQTAPKVRSTGWDGWKKDMGLE